jgi:flagellar biosynthesis protein FlhG
VIDQASKLRVMVKEQTASPARSSTGETVAAGTVKLCRTIAITSGKGGVGKSNIALMLAIALANAHKKVLLLDADLGLANIHILLGLAPRGNISNLLNDSGNVDEVICDGPGGIKVLPGASGLEDMANIEPLRLEMLRRKLALLDQQYDFMIVDTGAGIGRTTTSFAGNADRVVLVLTPEPTSLADAYAMVKVLYEKKSQVISVIVNMASSDKEGHEAFDRLNTLVIRFLKKPLELLDIVPSDPEIARLVRKQKSLMVEDPKRTACLRITNCGRKLTGLPVQKRSGFFARLLGK